MDTPNYTHQCPSCGHTTSLAWTEYQHKGYPHKADPTFATWNYRCDGCGAMVKVGCQVRLFRSNPEGLGWVTLGRLYGPWITYVDKVA